MIKKITIFIIMFLSLFLVNNSYASNDIPSVVIDKAVELSYGYNNYVILQDTNGNYYIPYVSDTHASFLADGANWKFHTIYNEIGLIAPQSVALKGVKMYDVSSNIFRDVKTSQNSQTLCSFSITFDSSGYTRESSVIYSTHDIIVGTVEGYTSGDVFFQAPVVGTIAQLLEKEKMAETLKEIVAVLPVILTIVISFLAFRKAWIILTTIIRKA